MTDAQLYFENVTNQQLHSDEAPHNYSIRLVLMVPLHVKLST